MYFHDNFLTWKDLPNLVACYYFLINGRRKPTLTLFSSTNRSAIFILLSVWTICAFATHSRLSVRGAGENAAFAGACSLTQNSDEGTNEGDLHREVSIPTRKYKPRSTQPTTSKQDEVPMITDHQSFLHSENETVNVKQLLFVIERGSSVLQLHELQFQHSEYEQKIYIMNVMM